MALNAFHLTLLLLTFAGAYFNCPVAEARRLLDEEIRDLDAMNATRILNGDDQDAYPVTTDPYPSVSEDTENREIFQFEGEQFIFYNDKKVTWQEADDLCPILFPGSHQAMPKDSKILKFITEIYNEESGIELGVWIDGLSDGTKWYWCLTNETIPNEKGPDGYPPWKDDPRTFNQSCLRLEGPPPTCKDCTVTFAAHDCGDRLGFICQIVA